MMFEEETSWFCVSCFVVRPGISVTKGTGHDFSRATIVQMIRALQAAEKLLAVKRSEGYGLQPVRKGRISRAPEGIIPLS